MMQAPAAFATADPTPGIRTVYSMRSGGDAQATQGDRPEPQIAVGGTS
jgi:hypothetical protein